MRPTRFGTQDEDASEKLLLGGLLLGSLVTAEVFPRLRFVAYGIGGVLVANALAGFATPRVSPEEPEEEPSESHGVPHRLPDEAFTRSSSEDEDRPAPSPEGELGLSD
jgi:hypothetical protein